MLLKRKKEKDLATNMLHLRLFCCMKYSICSKALLKNSIFYFFLMHNFKKYRFSNINVFETKFNDRF